MDAFVRKFVSSKGIVWRFNIPKASWWGGKFEVTVKLTKRCLKKTLRNASLRYEELETVLIETEGILNSGPLTFLSCLITGRRLLDKVKITLGNANSDKFTLTKRSKCVEALLSRMFLQWKREYLISLCERCNDSKKQLRKIPKIADIVTIYNDRTSRQRWKLGKIVRLLPGKDNLVRAAELRTEDTSGKSMTVKRLHFLLPCFDFLHQMLKPVFHG